MMDLICQNIGFSEVKKNYGNGICGDPELSPLFGGEFDY